MTKFYDNETRVLFSTSAEKKQAVVHLQEYACLCFSTIQTLNMFDRDIAIETQNKASEVYASARRALFDLLSTQRVVYQLIRRTDDINERLAETNGADSYPAVSVAT